MAAKPNRRLASILRTIVSTFGATLCACALSASAAQPPPAVSADAAGGAAARPAIPTLPEAEMSRLREGLAAAQIGDWSGVRGARAMASDPLVRRILLWRLTSRPDSDAMFDELDGALDRLDGWPGRDTMRRHAEQTIFDSPLSAAQRVTWFSKYPPLSGDGQIALAQAYVRTGRRADGVRMAREAWRERALTPRAESIARGEFADVLTSSDYADRVDRLLWRDDRESAQRLLSRLSAADRAEAEARIALQGLGRGKKFQRIIDRTPASRRNTPAYLYDRARYLRRTDRADEALNVIAKISPDDSPSAVRETLFAERRLYIPRALRNGQMRTAFKLAADHGLTSGASYADGEWLAGWIALRFLKDPAQADAHFSRLDSNVSTPVSRARALYWLAQVDFALGRTDKAQARLTDASAYPFTYYGQLSALKLDPAARLSLGDAPAITPDVRANFEANEIVRVLRLLSAAGDKEGFQQAAFYLDDELKTSAEHELLSRLARENMYNRVAVRSAKAGMRRGIVAEEAAYPLINLPDSARGPNRPEPALILSVTRQESEFDPQAMSPVGARGLMQIMPATARAMARLEGMIYDQDLLLQDPNYNLTLGSAYLQELLDRFGGSYVLTIAAYNAGPTRARQWMTDWGDPRGGAVDVVDWIELIPISETRNYVQRVLENLQVYRYRLAGTPTTIRLAEDLKR